MKKKLEFRSIGFYLTKDDDGFYIETSYDTLETKSQAAKLESFLKDAAKTVKEWKHLLPETYKKRK